MRVTCSSSLLEVKSSALCTFVPPQASEHYAAMLLTSSVTTAASGT